MLKEKTNSNWSLEIQKELGLESKRLQIFKNGSCTESHGDGRSFIYFHYPLKTKKPNPKILVAYLTIKTSASQKLVSLHYFDVNNAFYYIT